MTPKLINLGLPKSGTTTLARALKLAGFKTAEHRIRADQTQTTSLHGSFVADVLYQGYFKTGDPWAFLSDFDAVYEMSCLRDGFSVWPQMDYGVIAALRKRHRRARFIATWRDPKDIAKAMLAWLEISGQQRPYSDVPGLPPGYGETLEERTHWVEAHYAHLDALFGSDPNYTRLDVTASNAAQVLSEHVERRVTWWRHDMPQTATFQTSRIAL